MVRHCLTCKDEIDDLENSVYCECCRGYSISGSTERVVDEYNFIIDNNHHFIEDINSNPYGDQQDW